MADQRKGWASPIETLILRLLLARGESYGFQLMRDSGGKLKRGTVYVALDRMIDKGLLVARDELPTHETRRTYRGIRRRLYKLSPRGQFMIEATNKLEQVDGLGSEPPVRKKTKRRA